MYYKLIRHNRIGNAVHGKLLSVHSYFNKRNGTVCERLEPLCDTLENADYLIPALVYRIIVTMSPKFGRLLPLLQQVPNRSGIRIHRGCRPEHSEGCVLVSRADEQLLTARFLNEQRSNAPIYLEICDSR